MPPFVFLFLFLRHIRAAIRAYIHSHRQHSYCLFFVTPLSTIHSENFALGYGGKFGVQSDRKDQSAVGFDAGA